MYRPMIVSIFEHGSYESSFTSHEFLNLGPGHTTKSGKNRLYSPVHTRIVHSSLGTTEPPAQKRGRAWPLSPHQPGNPRFSNTKHSQSLLPPTLSLLFSPYRPVIFPPGWSLCLSRGSAEMRINSSGYGSFGNSRC